MRSEEQELVDDARAARLLADLPPVPSGAEQRVRARVLASDRPAPSRMRLVTVASVAALAAAGVLLATREALKPAPRVPEPVAVELAATGTWGIHNGIPNVAISYDGSGTISGTSDAPHIRWDSGTLNVEVAPDHGIKLAVETREAVVRVVGTGFTVVRGPIGTRVDVRHGRVEVDCGTEVTRLLEVGDGVTCLPRSAAGLLLRARALEGEGGSTAEVLETLDRAMAVPDKTPAVADEIAAGRVRALVELGRHAEALDASRRYLAGTPGPRRDDVVRFAASAAVALGGCNIAASWLLAEPGAAEACGG